ncbi:energy-coupling factor ABC transporter ATP-binding protein [Desulfolithobacter sp.]
MAPLIELVDITFRYPGAERRVLDRISLSLDPGQRVGLIGPNGCGKTSLFHVIMGLLQPTAGKILFKGRPVTSKNDLRQVREKIGLLFQDADDQLFSPTVIEDVAFGPLNLGATPDEARERAMQTLARLGLTGFEKRITHQLSGGEKKLVSLATILVMEPEILLLDEPTNNLDPTTRDRLIEILTGLDPGYVIIAHDWDFLAETCREIYVMDQGRVTRCDKSCLHQHHHAHPFGEQPHRHGG